jgi:probable HAF family extracellular repeat protein
MKKISAIAQIFILTSFSTLSLLAVAPVQSASFKGLGYAFPKGISADGSVVVGQSRDQAFRWTQAGGIVSLGTLLSSSFSDASGVSADGSVIVGYSYGDNSKYEAFRWSQEGGMLGLGYLPDYSYSTASEISADGSVIVGYSFQFGNKYEAFRWTQAEEMVSVGSLTSSSSSAATGVSADGSVIVGHIREDQAFYWTQAEGMVGFPSYSGSNVYKVSGDGSVIVGDSGNTAFRWTQSEGMVGLGTLPPSVRSSSYANGVSADGSVIVGSSFSHTLPPGTSDLGTAFRWTQSSGMVNLKDQLTGFGLNLSSWQLNVATAVSADGLTIVGRGTNPSGQYEGWVANLSPVPEPLTILGSMAAIGFAASFERKFSKNKSEEKDPEA